MRNRHPGPCYFCGKLVEVGQGEFEKPAHSRLWQSIHNECIPKQRALEAVQPAKRKTLKLKKPTFESP